MTDPWLKADDGTRWLFSPALRLWTGWMPGEDGSWYRDPAEMERTYPEVVAAYNAGALTSEADQ